MTAEVHRTFLGDVRWMGFVQVALRGKSLVVLPFLTRELGAVDYGVWSQLAIITAFVTPFINWGTAHGFVRRHAGTALHERERVFSAWIYALVVAFAVVFAVTMAMAGPAARYLLHAPQSSPALIAFAVVFALTGALLNAEITWLRVNGESRVHALSLLVQALLSLAAIVSYLFVGGSVLFLVALTVAADALLAGGLLVRHLLRHGWKPPDFSAFRAAFRYGLPLVPMAFAGIGVNWVDRLVLLRHLSIAEVGVYNLVHAVVLMLIQSVSQPMRAYYPPRATAFFNAGKTAELHALYGLSAGTLFAIQVPAAIGIFFVAPAFMGILAPPSFAEGAHVLPLLFLGYAIDRQSTYNQQVFEWQYRQHWITLSLYGCFALSLFLNLVLVPRFGLMGAGMANVMAFTARYFFILALVRGESPHRPNAVFIVKIVLAGTLMGTVLWVLPSVIPQFSGWNASARFTVQLVIGVTSYVVAFVALGAAPARRVLEFVRPERQA